MREYLLPFYLRRFSLSLFTVVATSCIVCDRPCWAVGIVRQQLALTGDVTSGMHFGTTLSGFRSPVISENGDVAFQGILQGVNVNSSNDTGIWVTNDQGELAMVAREGSPSAGSSGARYGRFADPNVDDLGNVFYSSVLIPSGLPLFQAALWRGRPGAISEVARSGQPLVGIPGSPLMGDIRSDYLASGSNYSFSSGQLQDRIFYATPTGLQQVVAAEDPAPGIDPNTVFRRFDPFNTNARYSANGIGGVTFIAEFKEAGGTFPQGKGIWLWDNGSLEYAASTGSQALDLPDGNNFLNLSRPVLNNRNEIAFRGLVEDENVPNSGRWGIWSGKADALSVIAIGGEFAPGFSTDVPFLSLDEPNLDGNGGVVFSASVIDPDTNSVRQGVWADHGAGLRRIAYPGDPVQGLGPGATFSRLSNGTVTNGGPLINGRGDIAFRMFAELPSGESVNGYWASIEGELIKLAATGDMIDVNEDPTVEDLRRVISVGMIRGDGGEDGQRSAWNNNRQAVMELFFEDRTEGIFLVTVIPEPASYVLLFLGTLGFGISRKRIGLNA